MWWMSSTLRHDGRQTLPFAFGGLRPGGGLLPAALGEVNPMGKRASERGQVTDVSVAAGDGPLVNRSILRDIFPDTGSRRV
jgi:hypothetical protein